ncbi:hypothetical protein RND71_010568 [Anisodus tanguticus]|uniref:F-box domain-containing protein n=1 Tax=Anisodus tanguticus TaxID=243964 RepID=A0AAE1VI93_9SOLA|nr:hypothetical protein RND71_010568 [Anisodus tanguticus]
MEGLKGMFKGKGKGASSSRGNQGKSTSSSHLIPTQDDFVDTQHFPTIPLDLDEELFSGTQEDFNLDDDLDDTPTNVDDNTPTSAPSTEIPPIPPSMRRGDNEDRFSALPSDLIDDILSLLPIHDAARTSILSKIWRYIWAMLPYLEVDKLFCKELAEKSLSVFKETLDTILLQHIGNVVSFDLDVSGVELSSYTNIDRWMLYVTRNGVKELTLNMSDNISYKLPYYIFNCSTLTYLELFNCAFKPSNYFLGFQNLIDLHLEKVTFMPTMEFYVINVPLLLDLTIYFCRGTQYLKIVSPQLESVVVHEGDYLVLNCFMNCKKLSVLGLELDEVLLNAIKIPDGLFSTLNWLWHLELGADFRKVDHTSYALQLIKSFPNLSKLQIWVYDSDDNDETVLKYLDTPSCLNQPLNKLKYVAIHDFKCSKTELHFVKLLCARAPCLVKMCIEQGIAIDPQKERDITIKMMCFPRASPRAELFYCPFEAE